MSESFNRWQRLASFQARHAIWICCTAVAIACATIPVVKQLGLNTAWTTLLPKNKPSVVDLEKIEGRIGGLSTLTLMVQSSNLQAMQRFAKDLVPKLESMKGHSIQSVDWNVATYEEFVEKHRYAYAKLEDLEEIHDELEARLDYERLKHNPFYVDLSDEPPANPKQTIERLTSKSEEYKEKKEKYPGGYFIHPDRRSLAIFLRTDIGGGDTRAVSSLVTAVQRNIDSLDPKTYANDLGVDFAGSLVVAREEHDSIAQELSVATGLTVVLVLICIYIFFRKLRAIALLGVSLLIPTLITFAMAEWIVDFLNASTAFLGSIVIGNGINPNIIWLSRYAEEREQGRSIESAIAKTHAGVWLATVTASAAAAIAYGSLVLTDFRGFRDFGIIGGIGMATCWLSSIFLLPAFTVLVEKIKSFENKKQDSSLFGTLSSQVVATWPKGILVVSAIVSLIALLLTIKAVVSDPIEYDLNNLRSVRKVASKASKLNKRVGETVGSTGEGNAIAVLAPSLQQVRYLKTKYEEQRDQHDAPFGKIRTIDDLLPHDQAEKEKLLRDIRSLLLELRPYASEPDKKRIDEHLPPQHLQHLDVRDLPEEVARPYTEKDGTRGRIMFVESKPGEPMWDGRALVRWTRAAREVSLKDGSRPPLAGRAPVFADMNEVIWYDGPKAVVFSFVATMLLIAFAFRSMQHRLLTALALLAGILWMAGTGAVFGMKLNFLNFVAFPITFGNGVDYGVNVMRRYQQEEQTKSAHDALVAAIRQSGGAVVLCSLTTLIGYISLYVSANRALNSFGALAAISEVTCVLAGVFSLPALLWVLSRRRVPNTN